MNTLKLYHVAGWVAMVAVPIAPAFYFGFDTGIDAYKAALPYVGAWAALAGLLVGVVGALGLELVGILAGHTAVRFFSRGHYNGALLAGVILIAYVGLGITGLEHLLQKGVVMFLIAPLAYLLVGMQATLEAQDQRNGKHEAWQREREEADREFERQLKLQQQRDRTAVKLAKVEAEQVSPQPFSQNVSQSSQPTKTGTAKQYECVCSRVFAGSRSYNAHRRSCKIPANGPARIYENGDNQ